MREFTTYAIVLKKETVNEADGKVIFYSELMGKIEIVAKGLKKILAKFNSHLEPLNLVEITFIESTNKHLTSVWTMNNFSNIRYNYIALENTLKMLNFFNEAIIGSEKDNLLWQSLNFYLKNLNQINKIEKENQQIFTNLINISFLINLRKSLGLMPDVDELANYFNAKTAKIIYLLLQSSIPQILKSSDLSNLKKIDYNIIENDLKQKMII